MKADTFNSNFENTMDTPDINNVWESPVNLFEQKSIPTPLNAVYTTGSISEYLGNPLIECLHPTKSDEEWIKHLARLPEPDEIEMQLPANVRVHLLGRLKKLFIPLPQHIELAKRLDTIIRLGYVGRNPSKSSQFELQEQYRAQQEGRCNSPVHFGEDRPISSSSLCGMSGMGKTTTVELILKAYPQWVFHTEHNLSQIVWLKVECPKDGSVKELAINILRAFDEVLGTPYAARYESNVAEHAVIGQIQMLCKQHHLGLLVIDELQNLCVKKSGGREEMLNFFQGLVNELRIPTFLMGTHKSETLLSNDVRHSRRKAIMGSFSWKNLENGNQFRMLVECLWRYQYLNKKVELTKGIIDLIYEETQGVIAFVVDMFVVAQINALKGTESVLDGELFKRVARKEFECLQGFLKALRSNDPNRLRKYEDAVSYDVREFLDAPQTLTPAAVALRPNGKVNSDSTSDTLLGQAYSTLQTSIGVSREEAEHLVASVRTVKEKTSSALVKLATEKYYDVQPGR